MSREITGVVASKIVRYLNGRITACATIRVLSRRSTEARSLSKLKTSPAALIPSTCGALLCLNTGGALSPSVWLQSSRGIFLLTRLAPGTVILLLVMANHKIIDYSYFADIMFHVGNDAEMNALSDKYFPGGSHGFKARTLIPDEDSKTFIYRVLLKTEKPGELTLWEEACLAHEVFHLVAEILRRAGMPLTPDSEEAYAYYFQGLFASMLKKVL